jgi:hypothetical protein
VLRECLDASTGASVFAQLHVNTLVTPTARYWCVCICATCFFCATACDFTCMSVSVSVSESESESESVSVSVIYIYICIDAGGEQACSILLSSR